MVSWPTRSSRSRNTDGQTGALRIAQQRFPHTVTVRRRPRAPSRGLDATPYTRGNGHDSTIADRRPTAGPRPRFEPPCRASARGEGGQNRARATDGGLNRRASRCPGHSLAPLTRRLRSAPHSGLRIALLQERWIAGCVTSRAVSSMPTRSGSDARPRPFVADISAPRSRRLGRDRYVFLYVISPP